MYWKVPTHNLICGDTKGNIALQVTGLTPDRDGWNGRLPVPGTGKYEWKGFRSDLPREYNPERGYIATANDNTHPQGYKGRPVFYNTSTDVDVSRIARIRQMLDQQMPRRSFTIEDMERMQQDAYSLRAERDQPLFKGWTAKNADVEKARAMIDSWDRVLTKDTMPGAIYVRWTTSDAGRKAVDAQAGAGAAGARRRGPPAGARAADQGLGRRLEPVALRPDQREHAAAHVRRRVQPAADRASGRLQHGQRHRRELPPHHRSRRTSTTRWRRMRRGSRRSRAARTTATCASTSPTACTSRCRSRARRSRRQAAHKLTLAP